MMNTTPYIWMNGKLIDWDKANTHVLTHTLHYGAGVFEGVRAYKTDKGTAIFKLKEHTERLLYSANAIGMEVPYSVEELMEATVQTVKENKLESGYIRPLIYYGYGKMGLNPIGAPVETIIACWPWGKYLSDGAINVKISEFCRIHPRSTVADAKIVGHYVNSIMASLEISRTNGEYQEALLLDFEGNIAEGPGENFFVIKDGKIYTPPLGRILAGITRASVFEIIKDLGFDIVEKVMTPADAFAADECFFTGTAAEVTAIGRIDTTTIGNGEVGPITEKIKTAYMDLVEGRNQKYSEWLTVV
jgi:branched-chain amino acid aminotransferase